jgi:hypothetical protein
MSYILSYYLYNHCSGPADTTLDDAMLSLDTSDFDGLLWSDKPESDLLGVTLSAATTEVWVTSRYAEESCSPDTDTMCTTNTSYCNTKCTMHYGITLCIMY